MLCSISFKEYGLLSLIPFATGNGATRFLNQGSVLMTYFIGLLMLLVNYSNKLKTIVKIILILLLAVITVLVTLALIYVANMLYYGRIGRGFAFGCFVDSRGFTWHFGGI
jgi:hypothetical protein